MEPMCLLTPDAETMLAEGPYQKTTFSVFIWLLQVQVKSSSPKLQENTTKKERKIKEKEQYCRWFQSTPQVVQRDEWRPIGFHFQITFATDNLLAMNQEIYE